MERVDLELRSGQAMGLVGANGSGKTTVLQVLATLRRPRTGSGEVLGADLSRSVAAQVRRQICLVGHQPALYPQLSLRENLRFVAALLGRGDAVVESALETVGLLRAADRRADRCSQGMRRRADLARVLIGEPRLLLLDEADSGLDPAARELVDHLVASVRGRGGAAVVVSHDRERLGGLVDNVVEVRDGRLVRQVSS
ncbi:hypothetical protein GCM10010530_67030 [Kribbella aluminosa]